MRFHKVSRHPYQMLTAREKRIIKNQDPEILHALIESMAEHIEMQKKMLDEALAEKARREQSGFTLEEKVKLLSRALYGRKKESRPDASDRPRDKSQEEALLFSQAEFPSPETRAGGRGKRKIKELDEVVIDHTMTDEELKAEADERGLTGQWKETGLFDQCTKIQIIERRYVRELHRRMKYKFVPDGETDLEKDLIVTAASEPSLLPGMGYTTEFVASVVADKYISHMPLERQTREMESLGLLGIKNSTLSRFAALGAASLEPLAEMILVGDILSAPEIALHLDETSWKIQNKLEADGYMWVMSHRRGAYYMFAPTRSTSVLKEKLAEFKGVTVTDGWKSYDTLASDLGLPHAYCWAHARREFLPLESHDPSVKPILDKIDRLFAIEREPKDFESLRRLRLEQSSIVAAELQEMLARELPNSRGESQKRKAIEYTLKRWVGLTLFLDDVRIPMSNNEAERTIRHAVMGRKNYYGSGSHTGAATAATLFTIIESAKKNDLDPRTFILMSLQRVARGEPLETPLAYARRTRQNAG